MRNASLRAEIKSPKEASSLQKRKSFPPDVETSVLVKCRRRCAFCFGFDSDLSRKSGQIAHIDRNPANASRENAAYLCTRHHDEYDSRPSQTKRLTPNELTDYLAMLYEVLLLPGPWPRAGGLSSHRVQKRSKMSKMGVSLDVYDRRIPTYRVVVKFLRYVMQDMNPAYQDIFQFVADTDEALFLFDDRIADYLAQISKRAVRLHAVAAMLARASNGALALENTELGDWFSRQFEETRTRFAPFLQLGN